MVPGSAYYWVIRGAPRTIGQGTFTWLEWVIVINGCVNEQDWNWMIDLLNGLWMTIAWMIFLLLIWLIFIKTIVSVCVCGCVGGYWYVPLLRRRRFRSEYYVGDRLATWFLLRMVWMLDSQERLFPAFVLIWSSLFDGDRQAQDDTGQTVPRGVSPPLCLWPTARGHSLVLYGLGVTSIQGSLGRSCAFGGLFEKTKGPKRTIQTGIIAPVYARDLVSLLQEKNTIGRYLNSFNHAAHFYHSTY